MDTEMEMLITERRAELRRMRREGLGPPYPPPAPIPTAKELDERINQLQAEAGRIDAEISATTQKVNEINAIKTR